jgi:arsenite/tail-anchored protein-transporting ATPase
MVPQHTFFLGKGGVGKSTVSALTALKYSRSDQKVLLVSLDPAHNLSDIFQQNLSDKARTIADNLAGIEIDHKKWIKKYLAAVEKNTKNSYRYLSAINLDQYFDILQHSPGIEEYGLLMAYEELSKKYAGKVSHILFDMPPTALSIKFFYLASLSLRWLEKLQDLRNEIIEKRELITRVKLGSSDFESDKILNNLQFQIKRYQQIHKDFQDSTKTRINLIMNMDELSLNESKDVVEELKNINLQVDEIILNKIQKHDSNESVKKEFADYQYSTIPASDKKLIGLESLLQFTGKYL